MPRTVERFQLSPSRLGCLFGQVKRSIPRPRSGHAHKSRRLEGHILAGTDRAEILPSGRDKSVDMTQRTSWTLALSLATLVALPGCKKEATAPPDGSGGGDAAAGEDGGGNGGGGGSDGAAELPLTADTFEEAMQARQGDVADCFAQAKEAKPDLAGKLALDVTVAGDGSVSAIKFTDTSTIQEPSITSCIEEKAKGWKFNKTSDGSPMTLGYSLNLS